MGIDAGEKPALCAGQGCPHARNCLRYRMRFSGAKWASFDLERLYFAQSGHEACPAFERGHGDRSGAMRAGRGKRY